MLVGVVDSFDDEKGYGFIQTKEAGKVFVHHSNIDMEGYRTLSKGDRVTFELEVGKRGPEAKLVRKMI
jgi:CspA family cold shock protein